MKEENKDLYNLINKNLEKQSYASYKKGDLVEGVIEKIDKKYVIINIDGVYNAIVPSGELQKEEKADLKLGDKVKVFVLRGEDEYGNMIVSQRRTTTTQRWDLLEEAYKADEVVLVSVVEANSGGVIVNVDGVVGFIPTSQIDPNKVYKMDVETSSKDDMQKELSRKLTDLIGTKLKVKVYDIDKDKNKVIFSEKSAMSDQTAEQRNETLKNAKIGDVLEARVTAVTPYGIFVNAEGLEGLVHVSEISWDKVESVSEFAKEGDKITVKLIDISEDGKRVAYSIKQLSDDPWVLAASKYKVGSKVDGVITEVADYGVIIKIDEGVTGLIHRTELSADKDIDPQTTFKEGQAIEAIIMTISPSERKIGLSVRRIDGGGDRDVKRSAANKKKKVPGSLDIAGAFEKAADVKKIEDDKKAESEEKVEKKKEVKKPLKKAKKVKSEE